MKFTELKEEYGKVKNWTKCITKIEKYIPLAIKIQLIEGEIDEDGNTDGNGIVASIVQNENGFAFINQIQYEMQLHGSICSLYCDIDFDESDIITSDDIDFLLSNDFDLWSGIKTNDINRFKKMLKESCELEVRKQNSIGSIITNLMSTLDPEALSKSFTEFKENNSEVIDLLGSLPEKLGQKKNEVIINEVQDELKAKKAKVTKK